jgi:hypothetical protein
MFAQFTNFRPTKKFHSGETLVAGVRGVNSQANQSIHRDIYVSNCNIRPRLFTSIQF